MQNIKIRSMKQVKEHMEDMNMKHLFRRNQIIIAMLTVMITAAGYLNYAGKKDLTNGNTVYEAEAIGILDENILAENQAAPLTGQSGLQKIPSLDQDPSDLDTVSDANSAQAAANPRTDAGALARAGNNVAVGEATQATGTGQTVDAEQMAQAGTDGSARTGLEDPGETILTNGMSVADYTANVQLSKEQTRAKNKKTLMALINSTNIDEVVKQQATQDMIKLTEISEKESTAGTLLMVKDFSDPVVSITRDKVDVVINTPSVTDPQRAQIEDIVKHKAGVGADQIIITLLSIAE